MPVADRPRVYFCSSCCSIKGRVCSKPVEPQVSVGVSLMVWSVFVQKKKRLPLRSGKATILEVVQLSENERV